MPIVRVIDSVVFFLLLSVIVLTIVPYGTAESWWEALFECVIFGITAVWVLKVLLAGKWEVGKLGLALPLVCLTLFAFAQIVVWPAWLTPSALHLSSQHTLTIDRYQTYLTARKILALTVFFSLLLLHTSTPSRLRWLVRTIIGLGLASAIFGILRQLLQSPDSPTGFVLPFLFYKLGYGQFISHNDFAYLMEMTLGVIGGLLLGRGISRDRILICLSLIVPVWTALVLSESRGGVLSFVCETIFLTMVSLSWYSRRNLDGSEGAKRNILAFLQGSIVVRILVVGLMICTLLVGVFWMGGESFSARVQLMDTADPELGMTRRDVWQSGWQLIKHNPWTGTGFGTFYLAIPEYQKGTGTIRVEQAHQDYLDLAVNGGAVAVALAAWFLIMVFRGARVSLKSADAYRRAAALGATAGILSVCFHSFVDFGLQLTGIAVVFGALIVIAVADDRLVSAVKPKRRPSLVITER